MHSCQIKFSSHVINLISGGVTTDEINTYIIMVVFLMSICKNMQHIVVVPAEVLLLIDKTVGV